MKSFCVTQGLPLANPMAFHSVDDLRQTLCEANNALLDLTERFHEMSTVARETAQLIAWIIKARRDQGDEAALQMLGKLEESLLNPDAPTQAAPGGLH